MNLVDVNGMDPGPGGAEDAAASVGDSWSTVLRDTYALAFGGVKGLIALHLADYFYDIGAPTSWARSALDVDDVVDRDSEAYKWGQFCAEMATPGGGGAGGARLLKIADRWAKGTFGKVADSIEYHFAKHGAGRTLQQYTDDAVRFFEQNKGQAQWGKWHPNWEPSYRLKIGNQGGYYTADGRVLTYWD